MAKRKSTKKKNLKAEVKQKRKELPIAPRLRLEPRLTLSPSKKKRGCQDYETEKSSICFEENELEGSASQQESCYEADSYVTSSCEEQQRNEAFDGVSASIGEESMNHKTASHEIQSPSKNNEIMKSSYTKNLTMQKKKRLWELRPPRKGLNWTDREWMDLAISLQAHGFADTKKLAECVKTKNENDIQQYIKLRRMYAGSNPNVEKPDRQGNRWNTLNPEFLSSWPNIRKWKKVAYEQMLSYTRSKDYSKPVISALCKKFYEEEEEPADPQVINVKLIYKYMMDCMAGEIPPQLPPKESALVLDLLREVRLMPIAYDFEEERKFLQDISRSLFIDFRTATKFKPFQVKDEFKKRYRKEEPTEMFTANTISVPEEVFLDLSRHKRLTQSFNPLVTPVWMLQKEQEVLEKHAAESNVYVD